MPPAKNEGDLASHPPASLTLDELESYNTCIFPTLSNARALEDNDMSSFDTVVACMEETLEFCNNHDVSVTSLLQAVWSIVLGGYTGSSGITFVINDAEKAHSTSLFGVQLDWTRSLLETVQHVHWSETSSISLSTDQRQRLLQSGPIHVTNTELRFDLNGSKIFEDVKPVEAPLVSRVDPLRY